MKSNSDNKPKVFLSLGDGYYHYNYNIKEVETTDDDNPRVIYEYDTVLLNGKPTYDKCVRAILRDLLDENEEFSLINKYNSFMLGLSEDEEYRTKYEDYIRKTTAIKEMVRADIQLFE